MTSISLFIYTIRHIYQMTVLQVLKALKRWDRFVFKSPDAVTHTGAVMDDPNPSSSSSSASTAYSLSNKSNHNHNKTTSDVSSSKNSHDTRPFHKVILLCGAPGTGKVSRNECYLVSCYVHTHIGIYHPSSVMKHAYRLTICRRL